MEERSSESHPAVRAENDGGDAPAGDVSSEAASGAWAWRRADQSAIGGLVALALVALVAWWWGHGGASGELIEFEHAPSARVVFEVDVNSADWPELAQLPGIGERTARRIIDWRREHGPFRRQADLLQVDGIGPITLDGFRDYLANLPP